MGQSTNGILAYGYSLGGGDSEWEIEEAGEYGEWEPDWVGDDDVISAAEQRLLASAGLTEESWVADGYGERLRAAKAQVGVEFESHCSGEYPMWLLSAHHVTAYRGDVKTVDFAALEQQRTAEDWDGKLASALRVLGITPKQEKPGWVLVSYWG